jgi:hypothetical protein
MLVLLASLAFACPDPTPSLPPVTSADPRWEVGAGNFAALHAPRRTTPDQVNGRPESPAVAVVADGESLVIPLAVLVAQHVVDARVGHTWVVVVYDPHANVATAFRAEHAGKRLRFDEAGLVRGAVLLVDAETGSRWSAYAGVAVDGTSVGVRLEPLPVVRGPWAVLAQRLPAPTAPRPEGVRFGPVPPDRQRALRLGGSLPSQVSATLAVQPGDDLLAHEHGAGLVVGDEALFVPIDRLRGGLFSVAAGGIDVAVLPVFGGMGVTAVARCVGGEPRDLVPAEVDGLPAFHDRGTGTTWRLDGVGVEGPLAAEPLRVLPVVVGDWYAWVQHYPTTRIATPSTEPPPAQAPPGAGG